MHSIVKLLSSLAVSCLFSSTALAQDTNLGWDKDYGSAGPWSIGFNSDRGHCLAAGSYQGGTVFVFGLDTTKDEGVIGIFNEKWSNVRNGRTYQLEFSFGGRRWNGPALGGGSHWGKGYYSENLKASFIEEIARSDWMEVRRNGRRLDRLSLEGTRNAINAVIDCQRAAGDQKLTQDSSEVRLRTYHCAQTDEEKQAQRIVYTPLSTSKPAKVSAAGFQIGVHLESGSFPCKRETSPPTFIGRCDTRVKLIDVKLRTRGGSMRSVDIPPSVYFGLEDAHSVAVSQGDRQSIIIDFSVADGAGAHSVCLLLRGERIVRRVRYVDFPPLHVFDDTSFPE